MKLKFQYPPLLILLKVTENYLTLRKQGIFDIEDRAFFEDEQHTKLFARVAEIFRLGNVLLVLGSNATIFRERPYAHAYEYFALKKL